MIIVLLGCCCRNAHLICIILLPLGLCCRHVASYDPMACTQYMDMQRIVLSRKLTLYEQHSFVVLSSSSAAASCISDVMQSSATPPKMVRRVA